MDEYEEKSLAEKLGFKPGDTICVETTPGWYTQFADDNELELEPGLPTTHAHIFCRSKSELATFLHENDLPQIERSLWVSWIKKSSEQRSELTENDIRSAMLPLGWVDVKVASVDEDWSGLQFVRRKKPKS
jgi:hypothetical protein